jgi:hypothetical protein
MAICHIQKFSVDTLAGIGQIQTCLSQGPCFSINTLKTLA